MKTIQQRILLPILVMIALSSSLSAQNKYDFAQFGKETGLFFSQPIRWTGSDWVSLGLFGLGTTMAVQFVDLPMRKFTQANQIYASHFIVEGARIYGEVYSPAVFFSVFAIHSLATNDKFTRKIGYEIGEASIFAAGLTFVLKTLTGRARPNVTDSTKDFHPLDPLNMGDDYHSFPSGHTTVAWTLSTVFSRNITPLWGKILVYLPALITPISRVYQNKHWVSDVVIGAAVGFFAGTWVANLHEKNDAQSTGVLGAHPKAPSPVYPIFSLSLPIN